MAIKTIKNPIADVEYTSSFNVENAPSVFRTEAVFNLAGLNPVLNTQNDRLILSVPVASFKNAMFSREFMQETEDMGISDAEFDKLASEFHKELNKLLLVKSLINRIEI